MLWVDKHRPKSLDKMDFHQELSKKLEKISSNNDFPHLLFYGPSGSGKKTRLNAFIKSIFGPRVEKTRVDIKTIKPKNTSKEITITTVSSNFHIVFNPSEAGNNDRHVITTLIKEIAESAPILEDKENTKKFKVVVLQEVDKLTKEAQQSLRRTMEKYMKTCRILCTATIISPILSRVLLIRVPSPSSLEIQKSLEVIAKAEGLKMPENGLKSVSINCDNNMRRAIFMLELIKSEQYPFKDEKNIKIPETYWETYIKDIAKDIMQEQTPKKILEVRAKFYNLIINCIPPELILKKLSQHLMNLDLELQHQVVYWTAYYEHRLQCGTKAIFHLEAFVAKFMSVYKKNLIQYN